MCITDDNDMGGKPERSLQA